MPGRKAPHKWNKIAGHGARSEGRYQLAAGAKTADQGWSVLQTATHPLFREASNAGRIGNFAFTLGLNPGPARPERSLLLLDENVSEMGLGVAAGSYVIAHIRFARLQTIARRAMAPTPASYPKRKASSSSRPGWNKASARSK